MIGIITPYRGQLIELERAFKDRFGSKVLDYVEIDTVVRFHFYLF